MAQKNETPVLILSLLITLGLLGAGAWWFASRFNLGNVLSGSPSSSPVVTVSPGGTPGGSSSTAVSPASIPDRISSGDRVLFDGASPDKQTAVQAIASGNYAAAVSSLELSLQSDRNDPEALIYLNNARIGNQKSYTIAVSVPVANSPNPALEILRGAAQAQHEINRAGGMNGVPLKIQIVSDDNDPNIVKQVADALVKDASVLGVVGHFGSDASLAAAPIYQQGGLVMISPTSTSVDLSGKGNFVFRTVPSDRFTAATLSRYLLNTLNKQKAAVFFTSGSAYSNSLKNEFSTALATDGGQVVSEVDITAPGFDPTSAVDQAAQQGADVLVLLPNTATLDAALQLVQANNRKLPLVGGDSVYNPKTLEVGGARAEGMVVAVPWDLLSNPQAPFVTSSRRLWGADVNWRTAMAYDAVQSLAAGLRQNPTRSGVEQTLRANGFSIDGATGTVRFLPSGDRNQAMQLVVVEPGKRSGFGFDFNPVAR
jgi:branched-chain amino acid transport system substrate-binding protein